MKIDIFTIGGFTVHGYGLMIGIGFIVAYLVGSLRAKRNGLSEEAVLDLAIVALVFGMLGAKLLYVIVEFKAFLENPLKVIGSSGFVVYGGIVGGILACYIFTKIKKLNFMDYFDLIMPEISIAQGFGRIGCFLAGCCYGRHTDAWFGVIFPEGCMAPAGVKLIPTQLISSVGDILIAAILIYVADVIFKKKRNVVDVEGSKVTDGVVGEGSKATDGVVIEDTKTTEATKKNSDSGKSKAFGMVSGDIAALYTFLYGAGRFAVEFLRDDYRGAVGFLSTSQFISIVIVLAGVAVMVFNRRMSK